MSISRRWLLLVIALFCLPLFVGLGEGDIRDDEAIYSFAVDRMLETGDWLEPKSIPNEDWAFLEKPPLKFWIVSAPIRLGLLPHDQFGMRFWDALFGAVSLGYVYLLGSRLLGGVCGAVAALVLFVHTPLLFVHGLRSNNMEAALMLSYCGGIYHFLSWASPRSRTAGLETSPAEGAGRARAHAMAAGLYFFLGFMTKFVAAIFLPMVIGAAILLVPDYRRAVARGWREWVVVAGVVVALIAPWFLWAWARYGGFFWQTIFGDAIYTRMTLYVDPTHVQPWYFYLTSVYRWMLDTGSLPLVVGGLGALIWQTWLRRWPEGTLVLLWFVVPVTIISAGTSKLYHYLYPFLPPLALAAGYGAGLALLIAPVPLARATAALQRYGLQTAPGIAAAFRRPAVRTLFLAIAAVGVALAVLSLTYGPVRLTWGNRDVFKSSGLLRPLVIAVVFGLMAGVGHGAMRVVVAVLVLSVLPLPAYRESLQRLHAETHPLRTARDCILQVQASRPEAALGLYVDVPPKELPYPHYYYFRRVRPWTRAETPSPPALEDYLYDPAEQRPILVWEPTYRQFRSDYVAGTAGSALPTSTPMVVFKDIVENVLLLLPGPYSVCSADASALRAQR